MYTLISMVLIQLKRLLTSRFRAGKLDSGLKVSAIRVDLIPPQPIPEKFKNSGDLHQEVVPHLGRLAELQFFSLLDDG